MPHKDSYLNIREVRKVAAHVEHFSFSISDPLRSLRFTLCSLLRWIFNVFSVLKGISQWWHSCFSSTASSSDAVVVASRVASAETDMTAEVALTRAAFTSSVSFNVLLFTRFVFIHFVCTLYTDILDNEIDLHLYQMNVNHLLNKPYANASLISWQLKILDFTREVLWVSVSQS